MYIERNEMPNTKVLYPNQNDKKPFSRTNEPSFIISEGSKKVSLSARRIDGNEKWQFVLFPDMDKVELQKFINELQVTCDKMQGYTTNPEDIVEMVCDKNPFSL